MLHVFFINFLFFFFMAFKKLKYYSVFFFFFFLIFYSDFLLFPFHSDFFIAFFIYIFIVFFFLFFSFLFNPPKYRNDSANSLLNSWCHVKLLQSLRTFCVHHTATHHFTVSLHSKPHRYIIYAYLAVTCHLHFWKNCRILAICYVILR